MKLALYVTPSFTVLALYFRSGREWVWRIAGKAPGSPVRSLCLLDAPRSGLSRW